MSIILVTRPEHDNTTFYLSSWSKNIIKAAEEKGVKVLDLHKEKAEKTEVEGMIKKFSPNLIFFNGHGDEKTITGHKNQPLISAGDNEILLKDKITYALSCRSARVLGIMGIKAGAINYTGYEDDFIFVYTPEKITRPLQDDTAKLFLQPSEAFVISLIKGNTVKDSIERLMNLFKENILKLLGGDVQDASIIRFLWWDHQNLVSHGNLDAKI